MYLREYIATLMGSTGQIRQPTAPKLKLESSGLSCYTLPQCWAVLDVVLS